MKKISKGQGLELIVKLEAAGLNRDIAHEVITAPNNELSKKIIEVLLANLNEKKGEKMPWGGSHDLISSFQKIAEFKIVVPKDSSIASFRKDSGEKFKVFEPEINDENFIPSQPLEAGEVKVVVIYRLAKKLSMRGCLHFAAEHGKLPNAQGVAIVYSQNNEAFGQNLWFLGLDLEKNLLPLNGKTMVPVVGREPVNGERFELISLDEELSPGFCVVVFK
ncbi:MAG: hypothetical protein ACOYL8_05055 [Patescibacteria group bacterium]